MEKEIAAMLLLVMIVSFVALVRLGISQVGNMMLAVFSVCIATVVVLFDKWFKEEG